MARFAAVSSALPRSPAHSSPSSAWARQAPTRTGEERLVRGARLRRPGRPNRDERGWVLPPTHDQSGTGVFIATKFGEQHGVVTDPDGNEFPFEDTAVLEKGKGSASPNGSRSWTAISSSIRTRRTADTCLSTAPCPASGRTSSLNRCGEAAKRYLPKQLRSRLRSPTTHSPSLSTPCRAPRARRLVRDGLVQRPVRAVTRLTFVCDVAHNHAYSGLSRASRPLGSPVIVAFCDA